MSSFPTIATPPMRTHGVHRGVIAAAAGALCVLAVLFVGGITGLWITVLLVALTTLGIAKPDIATVAVVFTIYAGLAPVAVRSYGVPKIFAISFFLLVLLPAAYYLVGRGERIRFDAVLALMLTYLAVLLASTLFGGGKTDDSLKVIASFVAEGIATYFLLLNTIRTPAMLRRCMWAVIAAGVLLGSLSIIQNRMHAYDRDFGGLALTHLSSTQNESVIAVDDSTEADRATRPRAMGTIGDPNFYAQIMVALLPICALRLWAERQRYLRWAAAIAMAPILGAVVLTFSRGAALALIAFCAAMVALRYLKARYLVIPLAVAIVIVASTPEYALRVSTLLKMTSPGMRAADSSLRERSTIYLAATQIFLDHPLLGVGVGQVKEYLPAYSNSVGHSRVHRKMGAHNMYLELLADTGILGFGVFMLMVGVSVRRLLRLRKYWLNRNPEFAHSATGLMLAIAVYLVTGLFLHLAYARYFWLLLVLAGSASYVYRPQLQEKDDCARAQRYPAVPHARGVTHPAYLT